MDRNRNPDFVWTKDWTRSKPVLTGIAQEKIRGGTKLLTVKVENDKGVGEAAQVENGRRLRSKAAVESRTDEG
uniref:Uncharacterized protein n=1 Tax=Kalanchoe fedtschenkoi TaxID=63787 RepID=A0A7N0TBM4_KALFE